MTTQSFIYTGADQVFTVPAGVQNIQVKLWGGGGGGSNGTFGGGSGAGGFTTGTIPVNFGEVLTIIVGEGGKNISTVPTYGGGGAGGTDNFDVYEGGSGGGRSAIRLSGTEIITAGGGGASAGGSTNAAQGGSGGGLVGVNGSVNLACLVPGCGTGGTQSSAGTGGIGINPGFSGSQFQGGSGGNSGGISAGGGGGGGGGYYGGGGGAGQNLAGGGCAGASGAQDCAGGGGSSYIAPLILNGTTSSVALGVLTAPNNTDPDYIAGVARGITGANDGGNGLVVISYTAVPFVITKTVDKLYSDIDNTLSYTLVLNNFTGTTITNVVVVDTTPTGTTFDSSSLTLNGSPISGNLNSPGLNIGTMNVGSTYTLTYSVSVGATVPSPNPVLNSAMTSYDGNTIPYSSSTVATTISSAKATVTKSTNTTTAKIGDIVTYTIVVSTTGNTTANDVFLVDTMPIGSTFVANSLTLNGVSVPGAVIAPPGYSLGTLPANSVNTITFNTTVVSVPQNNSLVNTSNLTYAYTVTPTAINGTTNSVISNTVTIPIVNVDLSGFSKSVSSNFTTSGKVLTYTIAIPNNSNVSILNAVFFDTIPSGVTFIPGTLTVDGVSNSSNLSTGVPLGTLLANSLHTVQFSVIVN